MRIVAGIYKNRRVNFNKLNSRPTTDFAKESLFNLLNNHYNLEEIRGLDLFAGSGNISYEFISRGSKDITAIDINIKCVNFIKKTKAKFKMKYLSIKLSKVVSYLNKIDKKYDIIFADPPYHYTQKKYDKIVEIVFEKKILNESGTLVIEHSKFINFDNHTTFFDKRKYGNVNFSFFKK